MPTTRLQNRLMKANQAGNEKAQSFHTARRAALARAGKGGGAPPGQLVAGIKSKKTKLQYPDPKYANAAGKAAFAANTSAQTIPAGEVKVGENADAAGVVLDGTLQRKPTRLRFTPGKPAVMV